MNLLDWRLRRVRLGSDLPDLPEVRRLARLSYLNGFTFGGFRNRLADAREQAFQTIVRDKERHGDG